MWQCPRSAYLQEHAIPLYFGCYRPAAEQCFDYHTLEHPLKCSLEVPLSKLVASGVPSAPDRDHLAVLNMLSEQTAGLIIRHLG